MTTRLSKAVVAFPKTFALSGCPNQFAAGDYEILVEEALIQGAGFEVYLKTATYLTIANNGPNGGNAERRPITDKDLEIALRQDRKFPVNNADSKPVLFLLEDIT